MERWYGVTGQAKAADWVAEELVPWIAGRYGEVKRCARLVSCKNY